MVILIHRDTLKHKSDSNIKVLLKTFLLRSVGTAYKKGHNNAHELFVSRSSVVFLTVEAL